MRFIFALLLCGLIVIESRQSYGLAEDHSVDALPPHFLVPRSLWADGISGGVESLHSRYQTTGLRLFPFLGSALNIAQDRRLRKQSAQQLATAGVLQDGDILLAFRPELSGTNTFAALQLGLTNAAIVRIDDLKNGGKIAANLELPSKFNGNLDASAQYNTLPEEIGNNLRYLHILRPNLNDDQRTNLRGWMSRLSAAASRFRFQPNYELPRFARDELQFVHEMARAAHGLEDGVALFGSEYVFGVLALRNCNPETYDVQASVPASCVQPLFAPLPATGAETNPGIFDGVEMMMRKAGLPSGEIDRVMDRDVFVDTTEGTGPLKSAWESARTLMPAYKLYYQLSHSSLVGTLLNAGFKDNYTPAAFMVHAASPAPALKYVGTIYYSY